jgi:predicted metal-binding membrane protein
MTTAVRAEGRTRSVAPTAVLLAVSAAAWIATIAWVAALDMTLEAGTMGLAFPAFVGMWTLMMAAMMLPAISPLVSMYARSVRGDAGALTAFGSGYIVVWASTGVVAGDRPGVAHVVAVGAVAACGVYQLTPMKRWCLRHCRSPLSHLLHYASYRGPTRHLRAGGHHGLVCVGCCWTLMVVLLVVGTMNVPAMIGLAFLIALEKQWRHGEMLARAAGVAALVFAATIAIDDRGPMEMDEPMPM